MINEYITRDGMVIEVVDIRERRQKTFRRLWAYYWMFLGLRLSSRRIPDPDKAVDEVKGFWDRESRCEKKLHGTLMEWEERHPIMKIILLGVAGSITAGVVIGIISQIIVELILSHI